MDDDTALIPITTGQIAFYGDTIVAALVAIDGLPRIYVALRPICDRLGLEWSAQFRRLQRTTVLAESLSTVAMMATDGRVRSMLCLPAERLDGWLFGVDEHRVRDDVRSDLIRYQRECYTALARHFGRALHPETAPAALTAGPDLESLAAQVAQIQAQIARLRAAPAESARPLHPAAQAILDTVRAAGAPLTPWAVAHQLQAAGRDYDRVYVRVRMNRLQAAGLLVRVAHGQYTTPDEAS